MRVEVNVKKDPEVREPDVIITGDYLELEKLADWIGAARESSTYEERVGIDGVLFRIICAKEA